MSPASPSGSRLTLDQIEGDLVGKMESLNGLVRVLREELDLDPFNRKIRNELARTLVIRKRVQQKLWSLRQTSFNF